MTISIDEPKASRKEIYHQLIEKALNNYRLGSRISNDVAYRDHEKITQLISYELFTIIENRLNLREQLLLNQINQARSQALKVARQGDIARAEELMQEVRTRWDINQVSVSAELNLLYKSFQAAAEAYLDYRRGDFDRAWSYMTEAIITDALLETDYGYKVLFAHRLHLVQNLVRSESRGQRIKKAVKLGSQLLAYLEGKSQNLPFPVSWDANLVAELPPEVVDSTFNLVTSEIALVLVGKNCQEAQELWEIISEHINLKFDNEEVVYTPAYSWLRMKQALFNRNLTDAIELMSQLLSTGRSKVPLLWYATVIDLLIISNELDLPNAELIKQEIANDAIAWQDLPKQFLPFIA